MGPIILYTHAKNWEDPQRRFGVKSKELKNTFFGHLIPNNPRLRIFQKNNLAKTMGSIVLYTHANIWEDPYSRFGIKSKEVKKNTFFWTLNHL